MPENTPQWVKDILNNPIEMAILIAGGVVGDVTLAILMSYVDNSHQMTTEAKNAVIGAFAAHNIALHIDDGWMGGGTAIAHEGFLTGTMETNLYNNNGLYNDGDHYGFTPSRREIFHYCILAHDTSGTAHGSAPGDNFAIGDVNFGSTLAKVHVFMHELGHNILGTLDAGDNLHLSHQSLSDSWQHIYHSRWSDCVMYESNTNDPISGVGGNDGNDQTLGFRSDDQYYDYHAELWAEIVRDGINWHTLT